MSRRVSPKIRVAHARPAKALVVSLALGLGSILATAPARADAFQTPPLLVALTRADAAQVHALLARGANAEARDARGTPVLVAAAALPVRNARNEAFLEAMRVLLDEGHANPRAQDAAQVGDDRSALHMAAANGNSGLVKLLLSRGADVNQANRFDETPLYLAAERGQTECVRILLQSGADPSRRTRHTKMTALHAASESGRDEAVRLLLSRGADPGVKDAFGQNSLDIALKRRALRAPAFEPGFERTVRVLLRALSEQAARKAVREETQA